MLEIEKYLNKELIDELDRRGVDSILETLPKDFQGTESIRVKYIWNGGTRHSAVTSAYVSLGELEKGILSIITKEVLENLVPDKREEGEEK